MLLSTVVSLYLPKFIYGIYLAILCSDGPAVFSLSKSIIGNSAWFFKAFFFFFDDGLWDYSESSFLLDGAVCLHSNSIGGTVCISHFIFIIIIELRLLKISLHGSCIPPCGKSYKYWWLESVISYVKAPLISRSKKHAADILHGTCPITLLPFLMATAYGLNKFSS